jgi:phosphate transport system protein
MAVVADAGSGAEARSVLVEGLSVAEEGVLAEIDALRSQLLRAGQAVRTAASEVAAEVISSASQSREHYADTHRRLLCLIACQGPVAGDLRLAIALLHVNDRLARISSQCLNIATLYRQIPAGAPLPSIQLDCLDEMVSLADGQLREAARVLATRDPDGAARLREQDQAINEHNRHCFALAVQTRDDRIRQAVFFVALMARAIERIGDNAVDIARQAAFVSTGELQTDPEPRPLTESNEEQVSQIQAGAIPHSGGRRSRLVASTCRAIEALRRAMLHVRADPRRRSRA